MIFMSNKTKSIVILSHLIFDFFHFHLIILIKILSKHSYISFVEMGKSVFRTGISVANSMIGSSIIILPLTFIKYGILVNVIFVLIMAALMCFTCALLVDNIKQEEIDIAQSIKRKLGPKYSNTFAAISSISLLLISSVFFLMASDILYKAFIHLLGEIKVSEKVFKIICMILVGLLNYLKDLKYVFKLSIIAMGALVLSTLILVGSVKQNISNIDSSFISWKFLSLKQLVEVASINSFALVCHPVISPMMKQNEKIADNKKAVVIGYSMATVLYLIVGILGALAIYGKEVNNAKNITDFFADSWQAPTMGFLCFFYLFIISPIFPYVSKNQMLELIPEDKREKISNLWMKITVAYSVVWVPMNLLFVLFDTSPILLISFISAVVFFFITYFLPIMMTLRKQDYSEAAQNPELSKNEMDETTKQSSTVVICGDSVNEEIGQTSSIRKVIYFSILSFGIAILIGQLTFMFL